MVHVCHVMLTLALLCINPMSAGDAGEEKDGPCVPCDVNPCTTLH